jgi:hypothetical protein
LRLAPCSTSGGGLPPICSARHRSYDPSPSSKRNVHCAHMYMYHHYPHLPPCSRRTPALMDTCNGAATWKGRVGGGVEVRGEAAACEPMYLERGGGRLPRAEGGGEEEEESRHVQWLGWVGLGW